MNMTFLNRICFKLFNLKEDFVGALFFYLDYLLFFSVIVFLILDLVSCCCSIVEKMSMITDTSGANILQMSSSNTGSGLPSDSGMPNSTGGNPGGNPGGNSGGNPEGFGSYNTNRQIVHDDGNWSNTIRNLFVYGTGGARFLVNLSRGGTPTQRLFIIGTTLVTDGVGRIIQNTLNDPNYVLANVRNWQTIWNGRDSVTVILDQQTSQRLSGNSLGVNAGSNSSSLNGATSISGNDGTGEASKSFIGGLGGAKIGVAVVKGTGNLPPMQRVMLGVFSTGLSALSIGLAGTAVRNIRKNSEHGNEDSIIVEIPKKVLEEMVNGEGDSGKKEFVTKTAKKLVEYNNSISTSNRGLSTDGGSRCGTGSDTVSDASTSTVGKTTEYLNNMENKVDWGGGDGSNFIPSLLDEKLSPLEVLINCEILINIMILIHIILLVLILIQKFNIKIVKNSSVGFISKIFNKYKLNKIKNFVNIIGELTNTYLTVLIILNVIMIVFYIFLNVYINIELSSNLNDYINVYNKFQIKKGGILLLLLNCKIKYKNSVLLVWDKNKYVNKLEKKKCIVVLK